MTNKKKITAKEKLLESASNLLLTKGYHSTPVDEICADAEVSKGSFYHFFESKENLALETLKLHYQRGGERLMSGSFVKETDPMKKLFAFLKFTESRSTEFWGKGCLLGTFAMDLAENSPAIQKKVAEQFNDFTANISFLFEPIANLKKCKLTALQLASTFLTTLEGSIVLALAFQDPGQIRKGFKYFRLQLEAYL